MQSLRWYLNRLGRMSAAELIFRFGRFLRSNVDRMRIAADTSVPRPSLQAAPCLFLRTPFDMDPADFVRAARRITSGHHTIFHLTDCHLGNPPNWNRDPLTGRIAPKLHASVLDYRDERLLGNIKYLWEPNRHLHLVVLAQAYALTRDEEYACEVRRHIESWVEQCPYPMGPNWTSPLELGIRLINWSVAWQLLGGETSTVFAKERGSAFRDIWLKTVYLHARRIVRNLSLHSSANNHLIGELAGVYVAAAAWPYWPEMRSWGRRCKRMLGSEMLKQNFPDGGNKEQATWYQQFVLDLFLIAGLAARSIGDDFERAYWDRLEKMIEFVASFMDAGRNVPMIGDADSGVAVKLSQSASFCPFGSLIATGAVLFDRPDFALKTNIIDAKTRWMMGDAAEQRLTALRGRASGAFVPVRQFADSGYYLMGDSMQTKDEVRLIVDAGALGYLSLAAHGHADALSVVLSVGGQEILIDPGTYTYSGELEWRQYFRSTRAHNTVVVDDQDQSQQAGSFMWSKHANARMLDFSEKAGKQHFVGQHDGYTRLSDSVVHRREIFYYESSRKFEILDTLLCNGSHRVSRSWHFAETLTPSVDEQGCCAVARGFSVKIVPHESLERVQVVNGGTAKEGGWISRSYGRKVPCTTVRWDSAIRRSTTLRTTIVCETDSRIASAECSTDRR